MNSWEISVTQARLDANWRAISFELDAPRPTWVERVLRRAGMPSWTARLLLATPALRRAWFVAVGLVVVMGLGSLDAAHPRDSLFLLLVLAPLLPVLGVALAYGPDADPSHEITLATPISGLRLVVTRAVAVIVVSVACLGVAALLSPAPTLMAVAWLLPSAGLTSFTLAAMTWLSPRRAAIVTTVAWVLAVLVARRAADDPLAAFTAIGQAAAVAVFVVGTLVTWHRRDRFELLLAVS